MNMRDTLRIIRHPWFEDTIKDVRPGVRPHLFAEFMIQCYEMSKEPRFKNGFIKKDIYANVRLAEFNAIDRYIDIAWDAGFIERPDKIPQSPARHHKSLMRLSQDGMARVELELEAVEKGC